MTLERLREYVSDIPDENFNQFSSEKVDRDTLWSSIYKTISSSDQNDSQFTTEKKERIETPSCFLPPLS